ncbi:hypothetical protein GGR60_003391 [Xanthomonas arboricola]|nr:MULTISPECIES: hypothetical protein [Xanthomonas]MDO0789981.1 hypothetical protein [Xanthomonas campestris pv. campestris]MDX6081223.1 hypothetical protein [Xanthomonas campestris pv. incanae]MDX6086755.1 hypothetical protein [Xanthomonas campestris pv. incanae]MDX6139121.1 hypothetical protein [Xanthomonas campestris pv. incanae]MEA0955468.1 hypothetical protein [Xanthomonas campestris pv. campestris]
MNEDAMRNILIPKLDLAIADEFFANLKGWRYEPSGTPGSHEPRLVSTRDEEVFVVLVIGADMSMTGGVFPPDWKSDQSKANVVLNELSDDMTQAGIVNYITASDNDRKSGG